MCREREGFGERRKISAVEKEGGRRDWLCIMTRDTVEKIDKDNK